MRIIPTEPSWVPGEAALQAARDLLAQFTPRATSVTVEIAEKVMVVDPGENFDRILCPACGQELEVSWWGDQMDERFDRERGFFRLDIITPCCGSRTTLNDLNYTWALGFARLVLQSEDYDRNPLTTDELQQIAECLGCQVRQILAHY